MATIKQEINMYIGEEEESKHVYKRVRHFPMLFQRDPDLVGNKIYGIGQCWQPRTCFQPIVR